jgi:hypothetical protein
MDSSFDTFKLPYPFNVSIPKELMDHIDDLMIKPTKIIKPIPIQIKPAKAIKFSAFDKLFPDELILILLNYLSSFDACTFCFDYKISNFIKEIVFRRVISDPINTNKQILKYFGLIDRRCYNVKKLPHICYNQLVNNIIKIDIYYEVKLLDHYYRSYEEYSYMGLGWNNHGTTKDICTELNIAISDYSQTLDVSHIKITSCNKQCVMDNKKWTILKANCESVTFILKEINTNEHQHNLENIKYNKELLDNLKKYGFYSYDFSHDIEQYTGYLLMNEFSPKNNTINDIKHVTVKKHIIAMTQGNKLQYGDHDPNSEYAKFDDNDDAYHLYKSRNKN